MAKDCYINSGRKNLLRALEALEDITDGGYGHNEAFLAKHPEYADKYSEYLAVEAARKVLAVAVGRTL